MTEQVGVIGLGVLGSAIAEVLIRNGFAVTGTDPDRGRQAQVRDLGGAIVETPAAAAAAADCVITCLPNAQALMDVTAELRGAVGNGHVIIETSTLAVADKERARGALEPSGATMMDCPLSGNRIMALRGGLTAFASGPISTFEAIKPVLEGFCRKAHYIGPFGDGMRMKICGNILNLVHNSIAAEVMVLGMKSGLDPKLIHRVISGSGSSSGMFEVRGGLMAEQDYEREGMNFSIPIKDAHIITGHAADMMCPLPVYQAALQPYYAAMSQGLAAEDQSAVCKVLERNANCERK